MANDYYQRLGELLAQNVAQGQRTAMERQQLQMQNDPQTKIMEAVIPAFFKAQMDRQAKLDELELEHQFEMRKVKEFKDLNPNARVRAKLSGGKTVLESLTDKEISEEGRIQREPQISSAMSYLQKALSRGATLGGPRAGGEVYQDGQLLPETGQGGQAGGLLGMIKPERFKTKEEQTQIGTVLDRAIRSRGRKFAPKEPTLEEASFLSDIPGVIQDLTDLKTILKPSTTAPAGGFLRVASGKRWMLGKDETDLRNIQEKYVRARKTILFGPAGKALTGTEREVVESALTPTGKTPEEWERDIDSALETVLKKSEIMHKKFKGRYKTNKKSRYLRTGIRNGVRVGLLPNGSIEEIK